MIHAQKLLSLCRILEEHPLVGPVYHGGSWDGTKPIKIAGRGSLGAGAYFTPDKKRAVNYMKENSGKHVMEAYIDIKNPLMIHMASRGEHPCVKALIQLGMPENKAHKLVERVEENHGYLGKEISSRAIQAGYDGLFQYWNNELSEIVIWNPYQIKDAHQV